MTRRYVVAGVAAALIVVVFFMMLLKPKLGQISDIRAEVDQAKDRRQELELRLRTLQKAEKEAIDTANALAKFDRLLPPNPDLPTLIRQLQEAASISGINLMSIAPSPPANLTGATGVKTVGVNLLVKGGFFRLESFLARLESLPRVIEITSIAVAPETDQTTGLQTLSSTITLRMYVVEPTAKLGGGGAPQPSATATATPTATPT